MLNLMHKKEQNQRKSVGKDRKVLYKLMNNAAYGEAMKNLRNKLDLRFLSNKKDYLKQT